MKSLLQRTRLRLRKSVRRYIAHPGLQEPFRILYRVALLGMNYGGAGSTYSAGDEVALKRLAALPGGGGSRIVFDVGANVGSYVGQVLRILGEGVTVYAFEPSSTAFAVLEQAHGRRANVHLERLGIGAANQQVTLWAAVPGSVLATMYPHPGEAPTPGESVSVVTLDGYCAQHGIARIDLLKLDLEGGELDALKGARGLIERGAIDVVQFEFGQPSLASRTFFGDLFAILDRGYRLYRVLPRGLEPIAGYHETLEVFISTNYVAVSRRLADSFPR